MPLGVGGEAGCCSGTGVVAGGDGLGHACQVLLTPSPWRELTLHLHSPSCVNSSCLLHSSVWFKENFLDALNCFKVLIFLFQHLYSRINFTLYQLRCSFWQVLRSKLTIKFVLESWERELSPELDQVLGIWNSITEMFWLYQTSQSLAAQWQKLSSVCPALLCVSKSLQRFSSHSEMVARGVSCWGIVPFFSQEHHMCEAGDVKPTRIYTLVMVLLW